MWIGGICRETGRYCPYATVNHYCSMTVCVNHPSVEIITYPWMVEKSKETYDYNYRPSKGRKYHC